MAQGYQMKFGIGVESAWGTGVAIAHHIPIISESIKRNQAYVMDPSLRGSRSRYGADRKLGAIDIGGDVQMAAYILGIESMLLAAFGSVSTAIGGTGAITAKKHTFALGDTLKSLTVEKKLGTVFHKYVGMNVNSFKASAEVGQALRYTFGFIGKDETVADTGSTPAYPAANTYFYFKGGSFKIGAAVVQIPKFDFELNNGLKNRGPALGALTSRGIIPGFRSVSGSFTMDYDAKDEYLKYVNGTAGSLTLEFVDDVKIETANSVDIFPKLTITFPQVYYTGATPAASGPDEIPLEIPFEAFHNGTNPEVSLELINSTATVDGAA